MWPGKNKRLLNIKVTFSLNLNNQNMGNQFYQNSVKLDNQISVRLTRLTGAMPKYYENGIRPKNGPTAKVKGI